MNDTDGLLSEMCKVGKSVSLEIEICEYQGALDLAGTLFGGSVSSGPIVSGVKVHSWGSFNLIEAIRNRNKMISDEVDRHNKEMVRLMDDNNLRSFLNK